MRYGRLGQRTAGLVLAAGLALAAACGGDDKGSAFPVGGSQAQATQAATASPAREASPAASATATAARTGTAAASPARTGTAAASPARTSSPTTGSGRLSDCDYKKRVEQITEQFQKNVEKQVTDITKSTPANASQATNQIKQLVVALDTELGKLASDLRALNVDGDLKRVNDEMAVAIDDFRKKMPEALAAAEKGDFQKVIEILSVVSEDVGTRFEKIETKYPDVSKRLNACPA